MPGWSIVVLVVIGAFFIGRGLVFAYFLWRAHMLENLMWRYWREEIKWSEAGQRKREIVGLFRVAKLREPGYDHYSSGPGTTFVHRQVGVFANVFLARRDVQQLVHDSFVEAKGYFKDEIRRSFIPIYWPSVVINLPADLLAYAGVNLDGALLQASRVVTGLLGAAASVFGVVRGFV
jgi:hypothetical protein